MGADRAKKISDFCKKALRSAKNSVSPDEIQSPSKHMCKQENSIRGYQN